MKKVLVITAIVIGCLLYGCGPGGVSPEVSSRCYPHDLNVNVSNASMDVYWKTKCQDLISGYNIYISDLPLATDYPGSSLPPDIRPFNLTPFSGDTNPEDEYEHYEAEGLENGRKYYVSVRVVNPDGTMSPPSNEGGAVCGPSGEIELSIRYKSSQDGYSFELDDYVPADDLNNDLYFFSGPDGDFLGSPVKLNGFLKDNRFGKLSLKGEFKDVRGNLGGVSSEPTIDKLRIQRGDWIHMRTAEGGNAFLRVLDIVGDGADRKVRLFFVYNSLAGEMIF